MPAVKRAMDDEKGENEDGERSYEMSAKETDQAGADEKMSLDTAAVLCRYKTRAWNCTAENINCQSKTRV